MRKLFIMLGLMVMILPLLAVESIKFKYEDLVQMNRSDSYGVDLKVSFSSIAATNMKTEKGNFTDLAIKGYTHTNNIGEPRLPLLRKIISVPLGAEVKAYASSHKLSEFNLADFGINRIFPAQESVEKCQDAVFNFVIDSSAYSQVGFTSNPIVSVEELGMMRGERLFALNFYPVQLDAANNLLRVYNEANIQVEFQGGNLLTTEQLKAKTFSPAFEAVLNKNIMNYKLNSTRDELSRHPMGYLIISDPMFEAQLEPFITWKTEEGYKVTVAYTDDIGTSTTNIKNYIQGIWDAATIENPAPTYLLICGDDAQVPAYTGTTDSGHITDLDYVKLEGNDYVPEMYYGRFSARTTAEFQPQIDKTLEYEKYEMPDPSYLAEVVMIAGVDGTYGATHGNGQIGYGVSYYFNEDHGIESNTYLYPDSGDNSANIIQNISDGVGYANYTAHGYYQEWSSPEVENSDLSTLQNEHKYPVVVGNCCLTNHFDTSTCFGEQWLRLEDKGAVGYIGGTNSTYWDEDFWWGVGSGSIGVGSTYESHGRGVYDGLFRDGANEANNYSSWYTTTGQMIVNGNLAVTEGASSLTNYYWEIYSLMGDPSLNVYLGIPEANSVTLPSTFFIGVNSAQITADPYSYVAISMDGVLYGTAMVDASGSVELEFSPFTEPGTARVVITAPNTIPLIAGIDVIPNEGPYVSLGNIELSDANDNLPSYGETMSANVTLENAGTTSASTVNATLTTADSYITITTADATFGDITDGSEITLDNAFTFTIANNVPDQHLVTFTLTSSTSEDVWESTFNVIVNAPQFEPGNMVVNDAIGNNNGLLDPGETATISIPVSNIGHATSAEITANLTSANPGLHSINTASVDLPALSAGGTALAIFEITIAAEAEIGSFATLDLSLTSGAYSVTDSFSPTIGLILEDFETGDFTKFDWVNSSPGWIISNDVQEGAFSAQSSDISDNQDATLSLTVDVASDGEISFYKKVSCEDGSSNNWDFLLFEINGIEAGRWDGEIAWSLETFDVTAGETIFTWTYNKDYSVSSGSDCAWIDYIDLTQVIANSTLGTISGNVSLTGGTGNVEDVLISANSYTCQPNSSGEFSMLVPAGSYEVEIALAGYTTYTQENVSVTIDNETNLSAALEAFSAPANIVFSADSNEVTISWEAVAGASSYNVYSSSEPGIDRASWILEAETEARTWSEPMEDNLKFYYITSAEVIRTEK